MRGSHLATSREPPGARTNAHRQLPPHPSMRGGEGAAPVGRQRPSPAPPTSTHAAIPQTVVSPHTGSRVDYASRCWHRIPIQPDDVIAAEWADEPASANTHEPTPGGTRLPQRTGHRVTGTPVALVSSPSHFGNANARAPHTLPHRMNDRLRPLPATSTRIRTRDPPSESFRRAGHRFARHEDPTTRSSGGPLKPTHIPTTPTNLPNQPIAPAP